MKTLERWKMEANTRFGCASGASSTDSAKQRGIEYHRMVFKRLKLHAAVSMPGWQLHIEPWFKNLEKHTLRSPDAVLVNDNEKLALVVEAKMNWKDGRDRKLLDEYLPIVASAFGVKTRPLLITGNVRGLQHKPMLSLGQLEEAWGWVPGKPTPVLLLVR